MNNERKPGDPAPQQKPKDFGFCDKCGGMSVMEDDGEGGKKPRRVGRMLTRWGNLKIHAGNKLEEMDQDRMADPAAELRKLCNLIFGREPLIEE